MKKLHYKKVSGAQVGKRSHKTIGCESCNFATIPAVSPTLKTGSQCPSCKAAKVRVFDSKAEHQRACELQMLARVGKVSDIKYQPRFPLHVVSPEGKKVKIYTYVSDFEYTDLTKPEKPIVIEDVKGYNRGKYIVTDVAMMKIKHFEVEYGKKIEIIGR